MIPERTDDTKLALQYEKIRRQEYELITRLLEVLPAVDGLEEERLQQLRDALFHADSPFLMVFVGPFSAGKSSLINALLGKADLLPVGITPTTDRITMLRYSEEPGRTRSGDYDTLFYPSKRLQDVSFVDTPGLESVFKQHEAQTRRFLHRSDAVFLVMLATQAMTAQNVEYLRLLRDYGKNVIIVLNQADLLTADDAEKVRDYVVEQSRSQLLVTPNIWLVSAKMGLEAYQPDGTVDPERWQHSGLEQFDAFLNRQLKDAARLRQKLQTPLQIVQNVHQAAQTAVRGNQGALDHYQAITANIDRQLAGFQRENEQLLTAVQTEVSKRFDDSAGRSAAAIRDSFGVARIPRAFASGVAEMTSIRRLFTATPVFQKALETHQVTAPLGELREVTDALAPQLEGKDMGDVDQLVAYARRELDALPVEFQSKVIGSMQPPARYERAALQEVRPALDAIEAEARALTSDGLPRKVKSANVFFAAYTLVMALIAIFLLLAQPATETSHWLWAYLLLGALVLMLVGAAGWILRGMALSASHQRAMAALRDRYNSTLDKAAARQIAYGMTLRREAVRPLTRLVDAQTGALAEQLKALKAAGEEIITIEAALTRIRT